MVLATSHLEQRTAALVGASIPRSGHHFLQSLLSRYYGDQLFYCEVYSKADCCRNLPCKRGGGHAVTYQKSHDRQGEVPANAPGVLYVIQYREPVGEALSDRELDLTDHLGRRSLNYRLSQDHYLWWLAAKASYYRDFHDKWFSPRVGNAIYLNYADLASNSESVVAEIVARAAGPVDRPRLEAAVREASAVRAGAAGQRNIDPSPYVPRKIEESPHFDRRMLGAFEAFVLERCPNFGFSPRLGSAGFDRHPLYGLLLLHDEREPLPDGLTDRLQAASVLAPEHPEIVLRLAKNDLSQEKADAAITKLETLLDRNAFFAPAYRVLLAAYAQAGKPVPADRLTGNAVFACADSPGLLVDLAQAYLENSMVVNAIAALSVAVAVAPNDYRANHLFAKTLANERRWAQAELYARKADTLRPGSKGTENLLLRVQKQIGRGSRMAAPEAAT